MAICSRCGNYSPDGTVMCPVCGTPFPPVPQPVQGQQVTPPSIPSTSSVPLGGSMASQAVRQAVRQVAGNAGVEAIPAVPSLPSVPSIPSADSMGSMAAGGLKQTAAQAIRQFTGGIDLMATDHQGEMVLSTWQMPSGSGSVAQMGANAVRAAGKGKKLAWMWFLIPVFTVLAWLITQLTK